MPKRDRLNYQITEELQQAETQLSRQFLSRRWLVVLAILITITLMAVAAIFKDDVNGLESAGYLGITAISALAGATVIVPVPGLPAVVAAGSVLVPWIVGPCAGFGEAIGELTGYLAGYGGRINAQGKLSRAYGRAEGWVAKRRLTIIFVASAVPNPAFDLFGFAAGSLRIPVWQFFLVCWGGKTIKNTVLAFIGVLILRLFT